MKSTTKTTTKTTTKSPKPNKFPSRPPPRRSFSHESHPTDQPPHVSSLKSVKYKKQDEVAGEKCTLTTLKLSNTPRKNQRFPGRMICFQDQHRKNECEFQKRR
jgi:hypothetical protein